MTEYEVHIQRRGGWAIQSSHLMSDHAIGEAKQIVKATIHEGMNPGLLAVRVVSRVNGQASAVVWAETIPAPENEAP